MATRAIKKSGNVIISEDSVHKPWYMQWHDRTLADAGYQSLELDALGAYFHLKQLAAQTRNEGSLKIGGKRHSTFDDMVEYLAAHKLRKEKRPRAKARAIMAEIKRSGLIVFDSKSVGYITNWADEQPGTYSDTSGARRQRDYRSRQQHEHPSAPAAAGSEDNGKAPGSVPGNGSAQALGSAPTPSPSCGSTSIPTRSDPPSTSDLAPKSGGNSISRGKDTGDPVTRNGDNTEDETETEKERLRLSNSTSRPQEGEGVGDQDSDQHQNRSPCSVDIFVFPDPVDAAIYVTGDHDALSLNSWRKAVKDLGNEIFLLALAETQAAMRSKDPRVKPRNPGAFLNGCIREKREQSAARNAAKNIQRFDPTVEKLPPENVQ